MQKNETTYKPTEEALCVALKEKIITLSKKRPVCYEPQKLDREIIKLLVNEFGIVPGSFRLE